MPVANPTEQSPYKVVIVGEAPGSDEDEVGKPFVGKAGRVLRENLPKDWEKKLYWTNCCRCRPTKNNFKSNRTPEKHELDACSKYLHEDLAKIKPNAILLLGNIALERFWPSANISKVRGLPFPVELRDGSLTWAVSTFHPSYVMRQTREDFETRTMVNTFIPVFRNDLHNFFNRLDTDFATPPVTKRPPRNANKKLDFIYPKTPTEVYNLFDRLAEPYAMDIETLKFRPYMRDSRLLTSAFSDGKITFSFPVQWPGAVGYAWGKEVFIKLMSQERKWIAQSAAMEYNWVWAFTGKWDQDFEDTEALARLRHQRTGAGSLAVISRLNLGFDSKEILGFDSGSTLQHLKYPMEQVLEYNALDAWTEKNSYETLLPKLTPTDLINYRKILDTVKSTVAMEKVGLKVDLKASEKLYKQFAEKAAEVEKRALVVPEVLKFQEERNRTVRLTEPETLGDLLVDYCGVDLPKTEKGNQYSTDESDLEPFAGKHPLVDIILDHRGIMKVISTYIDPILSGRVFGVDGLMHPQYKVCHVATFRLSSENPNIQNWPKRSNAEIRSQVVAKPGHIFAAYDYGQLEGRGIAMYSRDKNLIKSFITEEDIHWKWLYRIIDEYPAYMDRLARISGETEEKAVLKAGRTIIKTDFVFASFYGATPRSIANRTSLPLEVTSRVQGEFWAEYADVKKWVDGQFRLYNDKGHVKSLTGRVRNEVLPGNEPANTPSQTLAAEIVVEAQNALFSRAMTQDPYFLPRVQIHDDILFELKDDDTLEHYLKEIGQEIVKPRFPFVTVPLSTECRVGYDWFSLEKVVVFNGPYFTV